MNLRGTFIALGIAAVLGGAFWYWEVKTAPARAQAKENAKRVFPDLKAAETTEVLLRSTGSPEVLLRRIDGQWRLLTPIQAPADVAAVDALLNSLRDAKRDEIIAASGANFADFGLQDPSGAVTFKPLSGKAQVLFFGMDNPAGDMAYAVVDGKPELFMTRLSNKSAVLKDADSLRDKQLLRFEPGQVQSVKAPGFELLRDKESFWQVKAGARVEPGKRERVETWLAELSILAAEKLVKEKSDGGGYGLGSVLTVQVEGQAPQSLRFSTDKAKLFAQLKGQPQVWSLRPSVKAHLEMGAKELMDLNAFDLKPFEVGKFTVQRGEKTLKAVKKDGVWGWEPALELKAGEKEFAFDDFLSKVGGAEFLSRLPRSAKPAKPSITLNFFTDKDVLLEQVSVGAKQGLGTVASSQNKNQVVIAADNIFSSLP